MTFKYVYRGFFLGLALSIVLMLTVWFCGSIGPFGPSRGSCPYIGFFAIGILLMPSSILSLIPGVYWLSDGIWDILIFILIFALGGLILDSGGIRNLSNRNLSWQGKSIPLILVILFCLWIYFFFFK